MAKKQTASKSKKPEQAYILQVSLPGIQLLQT
jgi:hypothetical protein